MKPNSLRLRLLLASAASIVLALMVAGFGFTALFSRHVENDMRQGLVNELTRLAALVNPEATPLTLTQQMSDPRYAVPYGGIYWQIADVATGEAIRSRSVWDATLDLGGRLPPAGTPLAFELTDPEGTPALAVTRRLLFETAGGTERSLDFIIAEDRLDIETSIAAFRNELIRALALLALALFGASWLQVSVGLSPLRSVRAGLNAVRSGRHARLDGNYPHEVMPMVAEVNALLDSQDRSIAFARSRAADLAHALKTPLTALGSEAARWRQNGANTEADLIENQIADMAGTIDHQLRLSRLRHRGRLDAQSSPLNGTLAKVVAVVRLTPLGHKLAWNLPASYDPLVDLDPSDLAETLGILVENAATWARTTITISIEPRTTAVALIIEDDGPGLDTAEIAMIGMRGHRLDQSRPGNGIGLSIVGDIVRLNGGEIDFDRAALGGLRVVLQLPRAGHAA